MVCRYRFSGMKTEFRRAVLSRELKTLIRFDHETFCDHPSDWFDEQDWRDYDTWWLIVSGRKIGCCAFAPNVQFEDDISGEAENRKCRGSLYIVTTGILPDYQGLGFGALLKCWQISYARQHGFERIITNTRKSNKRMIRLNKKFGFRVVRTTSRYYEGPREATVVMELRLE